MNAQAAAGRLPPGFEALEPFVEHWALAGSANRAQARDTSTESDRVAFYRAGLTLAPAALDYLDRKPLSELDEQDRRLLSLTLSLCHAALAVETQGVDEPKHAKMRGHVRITRGSDKRDA
jgi:hypothetical protein